MTEAEWMECGDPANMLERLRRKISQRKLRLFGCACARRVCHLDEETNQAVEMAERFADGMVTAEELARAMQPLPTWHTVRALGRLPALSAAKQTAKRAAELWTWRIPSEVPPWSPAHLAARAAEYKAQCALLRDLVGSPSRPASVDSAWLTRTVVQLAGAAYHERSFPEGTLAPDRLAVLADALEEVGCTHADILSHLRAPGPFARGCFALDLILGKS